MPGPTHYRTCNLCEAMCGLAITVEDGHAATIRGDADDPFSQGHICPKAHALGELQADPDRVRHPMRRTASGWQRVTWDEALTEAGERLAAIRARDGRDAIGLYAGNPTVHSHGAVLGLQGFSRALGTRNRFDANSQDANPRLLASMLMYGDSLSLPVPDVDRTDFLLMLGANPAASNGSFMTLGNVKGRLRGVRERGGRFVLVDPRRTETAAWASEHHFIRPGGDAALLLALIHVVLAENLFDRAAVSAVTSNFDRLETACRPFPPERVAAAVGLDAPTIRRLARDFAKARTAVAYGRVGVCVNELGSIASWLIDALNVVTGNFDRAGGLMFPTPAVDVAAVGRKLSSTSLGRWRSRVRGLPELGGQLPGAVMAEEIETPGPGQIRGFVTLAGNPVLSTPNSARIDAALASLEFMVSIDIYINETTRHAHLILPPVAALERSHYDVVFHALAVRNTAKWGLPVIAPPPDRKTDWDILYELGMKLGGVRTGLPAVDRALKLAHRAGLAPTADQVVDILLRTGAYGDHFNPFSSGLSLRKLAAAPHGIDLGPLRPAAKEKVRTSDGKVELAPQVLLDDLPRVERWLEARREDAMVLIGRRHLRTNNSWMHNCRSLAKGPDRTALLLNPDDAARLGVCDGQSVRVTSRVGTVNATARLSDEVMPGVVSLPHGYGHAAAVETMRISGALAGPNINLLTDEAFLDPVSGTAALNGVPVTIQAVA